jgi:hypothetical protein
MYYEENLLDPLLEQTFLGRESNPGRLGRRRAQQLFEQLILLLFGTSTYVDRNNL